MSTSLSEQAQLIQDYLDGHMSRGGIVTAEIKAQAEHYARRVLDNAAYEATRKRQADEQREQLRIASTDAALRKRSDRRQLESTYLNRFCQEAQITPELREAARRYAEQVLASSDPTVEQRAARAAEVKRESARKAQSDRVARLRSQLADEAGSNHYAVLRTYTKLLRQALDDLDALLFREAMRPAPQGDPQEPRPGSERQAPHKHSQRRVRR